MIIIKLPRSIGSFIYIYWGLNHAKTQLYRIVGKYLTLFMLK